MQLEQVKSVDQNQVINLIDQNPVEKDVLETKTEKVGHRAITKLLIEGPVKALTPAVITIGAGALGLVVGGIPGAIIGGAVGAQVGIATSDKIADVAGAAIDKMIDKSVELAGKGIEFVGRKVKEGITYVATKIYEKIFSKKPEIQEELVIEDFKEPNNDKAEKVLDFPEAPKHAIKN